MEITMKSKFKLAAGSMPLCLGNRPYARTGSVGISGAYTGKICTCVVVSSRYGAD